MRLSGGEGELAEAYSTRGWQIAGAYYGFEAIPSRWLAAMKDREMLDERIERFIKVIQGLTAAKR